MADETARLKMEVDGSEQFLAAAAATETADRALAHYLATMASGATSTARVTAAQAALVQQSNAVRGGLANAGQGLMQVAQFADDAQYGLRAVVNQIPLLLTSFGMGAGLAGAVSILAVGANQLVNHWDDLSDALGHSTGAVGQLVSYWSDLYTLFTQSEVPTETDRLNELAKATGLAASEQERLNRARAGEKGAESLATNPIETDEEGEREKQLRKLISDRGGSEALAARMAAQADLQGEAIDTGDLDEKTRDALRRAQDRLDKAERGGRVDPKTGMPTEAPDPEAIEAARRELEIERKRARAVQARREIADALASSEGQDALERRLGQLGLSRDAEGIGSEAAARARETDMLNEQGRKGEEDARRELEEMYRERAEAAAGNSANVREMYEGDLEQIGQRVPGMSEKDELGWDMIANQATIARIREAFDDLRISEEDYLSLMDRALTQREQLADREKELAVAREKAAEASRAAAEASELEKEAKRNEALFDRRVDRRADMYGQAFMGGQGGTVAAMLRAAQRGESQEDVDARLKGQLEARMRHIAPGMRGAVADDILKRSREQAEDFAIQRGFQMDMMGNMAGGRVNALGGARTFAGQLAMQQAGMMGVNAGAFARNLATGKPDELQVRASEKFDKAVDKFQQALQRVEVVL